MEEIVQPKKMMAGSPGVTKKTACLRAERNQWGSSSEAGRERKLGVGKEFHEIRRW